MSELFGNPYLYALLGLLLVFRNFFGAFPEPDPAYKTGFGSISPGYKMLYRFARGMTGDLSSIGVNAKGMIANTLQQKLIPSAGEAQVKQEPPADN